MHIALLQPGVGSHKGGAQVLVHSIAYEGKVRESPKCERGGGRRCGAEQERGWLCVFDT